MGIQNFSGGGFYGKVGVHVGQRLYDKFILRIWVKGTNPRTPKQVKWRTFFGTASKRASASLNINPNSGVFSRTDCPVMGQRIEAAVDLERNGAEFLDLYPVFPKNYNPTYIGETVSKISETATSITLALTGSLPTVERRLGALVAFYDAQNDEWEIDFSSGTFYPTSGGGEAVLENAWFGKWNESTNIVLITDDDKDFEMKTYWQRMTPVLNSAPVERPFNFTISSFHRTGRNFVLEFEEEYIENTQTLGAVVVRAVVAGEWQNVTLENPALVQNGEKFALKFSASGTTGETIWAFPNGASVNFASVNVYGESVHLTGENVGVSVVSTDLTRTIDGTWFSESEQEWYEDETNVSNFFETTKPWNQFPSFFRSAFGSYSSVSVPAAPSLTGYAPATGETRPLTLTNWGIFSDELDTEEYVSLNLHVSQADVNWRNQFSKAEVRTDAKFYLVATVLGVSYRLLISDGLF